MLLDGGRVLKRLPEPPPDVVCPLYGTPALTLDLTLLDREVYRLGIWEHGGLVHTPRGLRMVTDEADRGLAAAVREIMNDQKEDLRRAPKPLSYRMGSADDGGTLSGVARIFYDDPNRWRLIYEANRGAIRIPTSFALD